MRETLDEQYRKAALALAAAAREGGFRSVAFSSGNRREGTTSTVIHVARHLSSSCGLNPLVVEANRWRPDLLRRFGLDPAKSVAAIAARKICARQCLQEASGLHLIPMGDYRDADAADQKLDHVVRCIQEELEPSHDLILWDAPPLLEQADAMVVARAVSRMILVVESGRTRVEVLERIRRDLDANRVALLGTILVKQKKIIPGWVYRWLVQ